MEPISALASCTPPATVHWMMLPEVVNWYRSPILTSSRVRFSTSDGTMSPWLSNVLSASFPSYVASNAMPSTCSNCPASSCLNTMVSVPSWTVILLKPAASNAAWTSVVSGPMRVGSGGVSSSLSSVAVSVASSVPVVSSDVVGVGSLASSGVAVVLSGVAVFSAVSSVSSVVGVDSFSVSGVAVSSCDDSVSGVAVVFSVSSWASSADVAESSVAVSLWSSVVCSSAGGSMVSYAKVARMVVGNVV